MSVTFELVGQSFPDSLCMCVYGVCVCVRASVSVCTRQCVVVLGAGAETLCGEHVLMSTAAQYPAIRPYPLHTNTQDAFFMQAQSSAPFTVHTGSGDTLFGIYRAVVLTCTHGKKNGLFL